MRAKRMNEAMLDLQKIFFGDISLLIIAEIILRTSVQQNSGAVARKTWHR
jgi:hypothetical protein